MGVELTGKFVSATYQNLVQHASDGFYYDGSGNLLNIADSATLINYISDASLSNDFIWNNGFLEASLNSIAGLDKYATISHVDASFALKIDVDASLALKVDKAGDTMTGLLTIDASLVVSGKITGFENGVNSSDAINKYYDDKRWIDINRCGFVDETDISIAFNPSTYILQLYRTGSTWRYMRAGINYTFSTDPSVLIGNPPAKGMHYIVINNDNGILSSSQSAWTLMDDTLPVATINWDSSLEPIYQLSEEKHQSLMDRRTHAYLHFTIGTKYVSGGLLSGPIIGGTTNATNTFGVSEAIIADEDMFETLPAFTRPDGSTKAYTLYYRTNASTWVWEDASVPYKYGPNNRIYWDNGTGLTEAANTNNRWYNWYLLFTNIYGNSRFALIPGRAIFTSLALAQAEDPRNFDMTGYPIAESVISYQFSWEYKIPNNNLGKVSLAATPRKINITTISSVGSGSNTDHNTLAGLFGSTDYYHLSTAEYNDLASRTNINSSINTIFNTVNASLDYATYMPKTGDVSFYYNSDNYVSRIITINTIGTKDVSFIYNSNNDVSSLLINNYNLHYKTVTFERDISENIIAIHIT